MVSSDLMLLEEFILSIIFNINYFIYATRLSSTCLLCLSLFYDS